jgi:hypothetical protein
LGRTPTVYGIPLPRQVAPQRGGRENPKLSSRSLAIVLVLCTALAGSACLTSSTFEASSESSSRSSASSSGSSSPSSGPSAHVREVRDYTAEWILSGGDIRFFRRQLGGIAEKNGVSDWEQDEDTYRGIGRGLKKVGVGGARLRQMKKDLAGPNPESQQWIQAGYDSEKAG